MKLFLKFVCRLKINYYLCIVELKQIGVMKKFFEIWFNRVSAVFYLGTFLIFLMLFCDPCVNVALFLLALCVFLGGGAYVTEELDHTEGEEIFLKYLKKILG